MPPFQREPPEKRKCIRYNLESRKPFCDEGDEEDQPSKKRGKRPAKPFGIEEESSEQSEEQHAEGSSVSVAVCNFSLGWETLAAFAKSTAWTRNASEFKDAKKPKRSYDNKKRTALAQAKDSSSGVTISKNGCDPGRINSLLTEHCCCAWDTQIIMTVAGICDRDCDCCRSCFAGAFVGNVNAFLRCCKDLLRTIRSARIGEVSG